MEAVTRKIVDKMPVIRPIKTIVRGIHGDKEAVRSAFLEATRTAVVLIAGAAGFFVAGPPLAAVFSVGMGVQWDLAVIIPSQGKQVEGICDIIDDPFSLNAWIDGVVGVAGDGITGVYGGHLMKLVGTSTLSKFKAFKF